MTAARIGVGLGLVLIGMIGYLAAARQLQTLQNGLVFGLVLLVGCAVVVAPLLWRMFAELRAERSEPRGSGRRPARTSPRSCMTRCCTPSRSSSATPTTRAR